MGKFLLFPLLWWIFGNPFIAIIVLLVILYIIDRRYIGLSPSLLRPLRRRRQLARLKQQILLNASDVSARLDAARLLIERKRYREAQVYMDEIGEAMAHSAEYWDDLGTVQLHTGRPQEGEASIRRALALNPRVKYGRPYLRLAAHYAKQDPDRALAALDEFREIQSSSCEAYYRMGELYRQLGRREEAARAYDEAVELYRALPKYKRRQERRWALRSRLRKLA
ncbi:tetratricopeptide repeat protein [Paenibacillus sp. IB182496]|uniref:Tetratricopeptide repeat protein n=1 Tax=Paenibacillus sabuli TaxID=2772509 RepID=A0A927BTF0_9BACL|nr:tetratricopeptide repeat protein [Paenibacillus sabuli]MBD2846463.1 tetratricopeptide repeat protein [Paenibacillus sabuli]